MSTRTASGTGLATTTLDGQVLDTWYPAPQLGEDAPAPEGLEALAGTDEARGVRREVVQRTVDLDAAPADASDVYLRLHLLSHRLVQPHGVDLTGQFGLLANVVWTSAGPCAVEGFEATRLRLLARGPVLVHSVDKFPRMVDYVLPPGCASATPTASAWARTSPPAPPSCTRGSSTSTPGRSAPAWSRGGSAPAWSSTTAATSAAAPRSWARSRAAAPRSCGSASAACIGANGGTGISLGDDCVVEAGCYVTAASKVTLEDGRVVKGRDLSGSSGLLFLRDSVSGALVARARAGKTVELNAALHAN